MTQAPGLSRSVVVALQRSAGNANVTAYLSRAHKAGGQPPSTAPAPPKRPVATRRAENGALDGQLRAGVAQRYGDAVVQRGGASDAVTAPARQALRAALVQRSLWDDIKDVPGDVVDGVKDLAGKAKDLLVKKVLGPLKKLAGSIGRKVGSLTSRFRNVVAGAKPGMADILAPKGLLLKLLISTRREVFADAVAAERRQRRAANAAGQAKPGTDVAPGPIEQIDDVASSVEDLGLGVMDVRDEIVEGAILGDFKENPSAWNTIGQIAIGVVPIAGQAADVRDLVASIKKLHEHGWSRPGDWFDLVLTGVAFIPGLGDAIKVIGRGAKGAIKSGVKWITKGAQKLWSKFGRRIPALWKGLKRFGSALRNGVASAGRKLLGKATSTLRGIAGRAKGLVARAGRFAGKVGERASSIARGIRETAGGAVSKARGLLGTLAGALPGPLRGLFSTITGLARRGLKFAGDGLKRARDVVRGLKRMATSFLKKARKRATDVARSVRKRIGKMRHAATRWIREKTTWAKTKVAQARKAGVRGVGKWLKGKVNSVKERAVNAVKNGVRRTRDRVRRWLEKERAKSPAPEGEPPKRTFTSPDPLVGDLANSIEEAVPGKIVDVNVTAYNKAGVLRTDYDIELDDSVIQVKSGGGKGLGAQISRTQETTRKKIIAYGPDLGKHVQSEARRRGAIVFTSKDELLRYLKGE